MDPNLMSLDSQSAPSAGPAPETALMLAPEPAPEPTLDPTRDPAHAPTPDSSREPAREPTLDPTPDSSHTPTHTPTPIPTLAPTPAPSPDRAPPSNPPSAHLHSPIAELPAEPAHAPTPTSERSSTPNSESAASPNCATSTPHRALNPDALPAYLGPADWPGPPAWIPGLTEKDEKQLAHILRQMHSISRESGFAPNKEDFRRATGISIRSISKFFSHYSDMVARCGYKTQLEKIRTEKLKRRKAMSLAPEQENPDNEQSVFGDPIAGYDLLHAPVNEQGVVMLFGMMAKKLGFLIEVVRTGYPDCEAKRKCLDGKWRRVRIEFEHLSSHFDHNPAGCDLVVCWEHNAKNIGIEVLELKKYFEPEAQIKVQEPANAA